MIAVCLSVISVYAVSYVALYGTGPSYGHVFVVTLKHICLYNIINRRSQWPISLRRGSAATWLLHLRFRIPPGEKMSVSCECCVLSDRGLCAGPIIRREEFYRLWCVIACDLETSRMRRPRPALGCCAREWEREREREREHSNLSLTCPTIRFYDIRVSAVPNHLHCPHTRVRENMNNPEN